MKRREFIKGVVAIAPLSFIQVDLFAKAEKPKGKNAMDIKTALKELTAEKEAKDSDKVKLIVPEIAENGAVVPVKVEVDHPMEEKNYVKAIHIFATQNSNVRCVDVSLTPKNAKAYFATRVKLGKSQDVMALVELSSGEFLKAAKPVKVTIGGCG